MRAKKIGYPMLAIVIVLLVWVGYSINQPPKWVGASADSQWKSDFISEFNSPKGFWNGRIYWNGDDDVTIVRARLTNDGVIIHDWTGKEVIDSRKPFNYLTTTEVFDDKEGNYVVTINWEDADGEQEDSIVMTPKKRYFLIPN